MARKKLKSKSVRKNKSSDLFREHPDLKMLLLIFVLAVILFFFLKFLV